METSEKCENRSIENRESLIDKNWLALGRTCLATPSLLLQLIDPFRSFRFGPSFVEFFSSFAAQRLEIRALRAGHRLIFCYPLVGIFLRIE
jgi:hypothetical protein